MTGTPQTPSATEIPEPEPLSLEDAMDLILSRLGEWSEALAYDTDLARAREVSVAAVEGLDFRDSERDVEFYYTGFGDSAIELSVRFWLDLQTEASNFLEARSRGIEAIKKAFDEHEIEIPFPIRTLELGASARTCADAFVQDREEGGGD
jgi:small-conductance mechanosensitive channel